MSYMDLPVGTKLTAIKNFYYEIPISEDEIDEGLLFEVGDQVEIVKVLDKPDGRGYRISGEWGTWFVSAEDANWYFTWDGDGS